MRMFGRALRHIKSWIPRISLAWLPIWRLIRTKTSHRGTCVSVPPCFFTISHSYSQLFCMRVGIIIASQFSIAFCLILHVKLSDQCQMGKQTMGTPCMSFPYRTDNKLYRLHTPQAPIVQTGVHGRYKMDEYPNGTNAIVGMFMPKLMYKLFFT